MPLTKEQAKMLIAAYKLPTCDNIKKALAVIGRMVLDPASDNDSADLYKLGSSDLVPLPMREAAAAKLIRAMTSISDLEHYLKNGHPKFPESSRNIAGLRLLELLNVRVLTEEQMHDYLTNEEYPMEFRIQAGKRFLAELKRHEWLNEQSNVPIGDLAMVPPGDTDKLLKLKVGRSCWICDSEGTYHEITLEKITEITEDVRIFSARTNAIKRILLVEGVSLETIKNAVSVWTDQMVAIAGVAQLLSAFDESLLSGFKKQIVQGLYRIVEKSDTGDRDLGKLSDIMHAEKLDQVNRTIRVKAGLALVAGYWKRKNSDALKYMVDAALPRKIRRSAGLAYIQVCASQGNKALIEIFLAQHPSFKKDAKEHMARAREEYLLNPNTTVSALTDARFADVIAKVASEIVIKRPAPRVPRPRRGKRTTKQPARAKAPA